MQTLDPHRRTEQPARTASGFTSFAVCLGGLLLSLALMAASASSGALLGFAIGVPLLILSVVGLGGLYMQQPNEARILTLFGRYAGTDRTEGLRWANPFALKRRISLRARNLNAPHIKVNDKRGNPIEISAAVVWRVEDTARAVFEVDDFELYVGIQAETAIRHLATQFAYDDGEDLAPDETTLRAGQDTVVKALIAELQARCAQAGVAVLEAKITHLAYAPEIAQVMLRRQQAEAIISARKKIVQGAVTMVEEALRGLSERDIVVLDDERKAAMVSNLLVVLCSDKETQPIINTGTLYS
jgi:regulator of protease activity HflC (stomatin/prohibitin superfamily)